MAAAVSSAVQSTVHSSKASKAPSRVMSTSTSLMGSRCDSMSSLVTDTDGPLPGTIEQIQAVTQHQEAVMSLLQPCEIIKLTVQHDPLPPGFMEVTMNKFVGEKLGMVVKATGNPLDPAEDGVFCVKVNPGSIASYSRIKVSRSYIKCFNIKVFHESLYLLMSF